MLSMLLHWLVVALSLIIVSNVIPGIQIADFSTAMIAALVIGLVNLLVRPIVMLISLPINILTLGVFALIINAALFALAASMVPGFVVANFLSAFLGSLVLALITALMGNLVEGTLTHK